MIYFIEAESAKLIKIGYTKRNPDTRLAVLKTSSTAPLIRLALMKGNRAKEAKIHERFEDLRSHLEWFHDHPRLRRFMDRYCVRWSGRVIPGTIVTRRVMEDWRDVVRYVRGTPGEEQFLEECWPRIRGEKISLDILPEAKKKGRPPGKLNAVKRPIGRPRKDPVVKFAKPKRDPFAMLPPDQRKNSFDLARHRKP